LNDYYCEEIIANDNYTFTSLDFYQAPKSGDYDETLEFIKTFPLFTEPEVFGFHANADISKDLGETSLLLNSLLTCQADSGSGDSGSQEDVLNVDAIAKQYPVSYNESMNTVLTQELTRFNHLIKIVSSSLQDIRDALKGLVLMSPALEKAAKSLFDGRVPEMWMTKSYPSLKPLGGYVSDLRARLAFFKKWIDQGSPASYWLSGFFFTQSFLTGVFTKLRQKVHNSY